MYCCLVWRFQNELTFVLVAGTIIAAVLFFIVVIACGGFTFPACGGKKSTSSN